MNIEIHPDSGSVAERAASVIADHAWPSQSGVHSSRPGAAAAVAGSCCALSPRPTSHGEHGIRPGPLEDPVISAIAGRVGKAPAQVLLAWAVQRGTALLATATSAARARENFTICPLPKDAPGEINRIATRHRFNQVVKTGNPTR